MELKDLALEIARKSFVGKVDKGGKPYINHITRVAKKCEHMCTDVQIVAILHDLLEDCKEWNETSLRVFFSHSIVESVVALTKKPEQSYYEYITQVINDGWATAVKKADLEDNMDITRLSELTKEDLERLKKYHSAYQRIIKEK